MAEHTPPPQAGNSQSSDTPGNSAGTDGSTGDQPQVLMHRIYCRDASLEVPSAPQIFNQKEWAPNVDIQVGTEVTPVDGTFHQVTLTLTVTAKLGDDEIAYLVEVKQAGLFALSGFTDTAQVQTVLGAYCPNSIFPFARETVSDLVQRAGFPQLLLQPINFEALYAQHLAQAQAGTGDTQTPPVLN